MAQISKEKALEIIEKVIKQMESTYFSEYSLTPEITECIRNVRVAVDRIFGSNSSQLQEVEDFTSAILHPESIQSKKEEGAGHLKGLLRSIKNEIETFWEDEGSILEEENLKIVKETKEISKSRKFSKDKVFIIHGHDEGTKEKIARFLEKIDLKPIILHEKPDEGQTIIEKFEKHSLGVGFAIALLTPDDVGNSKLNKENLNYRARQNVILELGYFVGKLGRKRVCAMLGKDVEIPSDYSGILYILLEEETWKYKLAKELKTVGFKIDMNKVL